MKTNINTKLSLDMDLFRTSFEAHKTSNARGRLYVPVPHEYMEDMAILSDDAFGRLIRGMLYFSVTGQTPEVKGMERHYLPSVISRQKVFKNNFEKISKSRSDAGKKGAEARWGKKATSDSYPHGPSLPQDLYDDDESQNAPPNFRGYDPGNALGSYRGYEEQGSYPRELYDYDDTLPI